MKASSSSKPKAKRAPRATTKKTNPTPDTVLDVTCDPDDDAVLDTSSKSVTPGPCTSDEENVVVKLCVADSDGSDGDLMNAALPMAYNNFEEYAVPGTHHSVVHDCIDSAGPSLASDARVVEVLGEFAEKTRTGEWPQDTSVACYWCCHPFDNTPVGLPVSFDDEHKFQVFGCFCSLECACAYNFDTADHMDTMWERNALLNRMARELFGRNVRQGPVKAAPSRLALRMFGGHMTIQSFRNVRDKTILVNPPPVVASVTYQLEEVNDGDLICHRNGVASTTPLSKPAPAGASFVPLDHGRIDRYTTELMKVKRSRPITTGATSLEATMNVRFKT